MQRKSSTHKRTGPVLCVLSSLMGCASPAGDASSMRPAPLSNDTESRDASTARLAADGFGGAIAGTTTWIFPDSPNGLRPNQSWFSVGSGADGSIYVSGCDQRTNTALYRVQADDRLHYVGDARSASEAAGNWREDETAEKFHVRPHWYRGRVYAATADYSNQDDGYLARRGFHWYAFDERDARLHDLSASEPNGVGAAHISIFATALDEQRGLLYGLGSPTAHLYQYDIARGRTLDLGRPPELTRTYYNPGRFMWVDGSGTVYFTVGNAGAPAAGEPPAPTYVLSWSAEMGFRGRPEWPIQEMLRTGQWSMDGKRLYVLDYPLNLYRFDDADKTFVKLGRGTLPDTHVSPRTGNVRVRSMQLSANEKKIYIVNDTAPMTALFEWEFRENTPPRELAPIVTLAPVVDQRYTAFTGHDSWDREGRFYFTGFGGEGVPTTPNVFLLRVDPVRLKAALGVFPGVASVQLAQTAEGLALVRSGDPSRALDVILTDDASPPSLRTVRLEAGAPGAKVDVAPGAHWRVVPDGDTYVVTPPAR